MLHVEPGGALVSCYGRRSWIRAQGIERYFTEFAKLSEAGFQLKEARALLSPFLTDAELQSLLKHMAVSGFVTIQDQNSKLAGIEVPAYFERFSYHHERQAKMFLALRESEVRIVSTVKLPSEWLRPTNESIESSWFKSIDFVHGLGEESDTGIRLLTVVIFPQEVRSTAMKINADACAQKRLILPVAIDSFGCTIGPIAGRKGQPCLNCQQIHGRALQIGPYFRDPIEVASAASATSLVDDWPTHYWQMLEGILLTELINIACECVSASVWKNRLLHDFVNQRCIGEDMYPVPGCPVCQRTKSGS